MLFKHSHKNKSKGVKSVLPSRLGIYRKSKINIWKCICCNFINTFWYFTHLKIIRWIPVLWTVNFKSINIWHNSKVVQHFLYIKLSSFHWLSKMNKEMMTEIGNQEGQWRTWYSFKYHDTKVNVFPANNFFGRLYLIRFNYTIFNATEPSNDRFNGPL